MPSSCSGRIKRVAHPEQDKESSPSPAAALARSVDWPTPSSCSSKIRRIAQAKQLL
jgi:hypothetical protein